MSYIQNWQFFYSINSNFNLGVRHFFFWQCIVGNGLQIELKYFHPSSQTKNQDWKRISMWNDPPNFWDKTRNEKKLFSRVLSGVAFKCIVVSHIIFTFYSSLNLFSLPSKTLSFHSKLFSDTDTFGGVFEQTKVIVRSPFMVWAPSSYGRAAILWFRQFLHHGPYITLGAGTTPPCWRSPKAI